MPQKQQQSSLLSSSLISKPYIQLIGQLKSQGLFFSQQCLIKLPKCQPPPPTIISKLFSIFTTQNKKYDYTKDKKIYPLEEKIIIITQCNTLAVYEINKREGKCNKMENGKYNMDKEHKSNNNNSSNNSSNNNSNNQNNSNTSNSNNNNQNNSNNSNSNNNNNANQSKLETKLLTKFHMQQSICQLIFTPANLTYPTKSHFLYFLIYYQKSTLLSLFMIKKQYKYQLQLKHQIRIKSSILQIDFINNTEFIIVNSKYEVLHYKIQKDSLKNVNSLGSIYKKTNTNITEQIVSLKILSQARQQQQTVISVFYSIYTARTKKGSLHVREIIRQLQGNTYLSSQLFQICSSEQLSRQQLLRLEIICVKQHFLCKLSSQIFIITKHFQKYVLMDVITQKLIMYKQVIISNNVPLLCCVNNQNVELWYFQIKNKKMISRLVDVVTFQDYSITNNERNTINHKDKIILLKFWVMSINNKIETIFAVDRHNRQIGLFGVKKIDKVTKLAERISKVSSKNQISNVQQLGKKLGVDRKSLYIKLWKQNPKNPSNIHQYLLQCYDLSSIHFQLQKYMRRKPILTGQLLKILQQIQSILLQKLISQLNIKNLKWFLKTNFQRRKLNFYDFNTQITFKQFQQIYSSSIYELIQKNIDKKLFPEKLVSNIIWEEKPYEEPEIDILQILQQFKLLILENYQEFLLTLLSGYKYNLIQVMLVFHILLPKHPFTMEVFKQNNISLSSMNLNLSNLNINNNDKQKLPSMISSINYYNSMYNKKDKQQKYYIEKHVNNYEKISKSIPLQKAWFSQITQDDWGRQKSSSDFIFTKLYPNYPTHEINLLISQLTELQWSKKCKFHKHSFMSTTLINFKKQIQKIQGTYLYLSVCEYANRINLQLHEKIKNNSLDEEDYKYLKKVLFQKNKNKNNQNKSNKNINVNVNNTINDATNDQVDQFLIKNKHNLKNIILSQAQTFLKIMRKNNGLDQKSFQQCLLHSKMHQLLVGHEIVKKQTTIKQLINITHSSLIAAFFLGNKQRDSQLFNQFMTIYPDKQLFYRALTQFIESNNCSRVELQILFNQLKKRNNQQYQQQNIRLAKLIIYGFCLRTQIRQKLEANTFINMFKSIFVEVQEIIIFQTIQIINNQLGHILEFFMCEKLSYWKVLNQPNEVITIMIQNYFHGNLNFQALEKANKLRKNKKDNQNYDNQQYYQSSYGRILKNTQQQSSLLDLQQQYLYIEDRAYCMDTIANTFYVMYYIKQKIYVDMEQKELCLLYGKILIDWEQFNILKQIFTDQHEYTKHKQFQSQQSNIYPFSLKSLTSTEFFLQLITNTLTQIYNSQNIYMDAQTISHIYKILNLLQSHPNIPLIISQKAKLQLCKILQGWNYQLKSIMLQNMCIKWKQNQDQLMQQFIDHCIDYFDLDQLINLYILLEATKLGEYVQKIKNQHTIKYALYLGGEVVQTEYTKQGKGFCYQQDNILCQQKLKVVSSRVWNHVGNILKNSFEQILSNSS